MGPTTDDLRWWGRTARDRALSMALMSRVEAPSDIAPRYDKAPRREFMVPMRDGVRLATDVYLPAQPIGHDTDARPGPFPALVVRQPYGKREPFLWMPVQGRYWARRGYALVVQDVRGRWASEGEYEPFFHELDDGYDTVDWVAKQPWCDGTVGVMGESYFGYTTWAMAVGGHPAIKAACPGDTTPDMYASAFRDGALCYNPFGVWALWISGHRFRNYLRADSYHLPLEEIDEACGLPSEPWKLLTGHFPKDELWRSIDLRPRLGEVQVPVMQWSGWYDNFLERDAAHLARQQPAARRAGRPVPGARRHRPHAQPGAQRPHRQRQGGRPRPLGTTASAASSTGTCGAPRRSSRRRPSRTSRSAATSGARPRTGRRRARRASSCSRRPPAPAATASPRAGPGAAASLPAPAPAAATLAYSYDPQHPLDAWVGTDGWAPAQHMRDRAPFAARAGRARLRHAAARGRPRGHRPAATVTLFASTSARRHRLRRDAGRRVPRRLRAPRAAGHRAGAVPRAAATRPSSRARSWSTPSTSGTPATWSAPATACASRSRRASSTATTATSTATSRGAPAARRASRSSRSTSAASTPTRLTLSGPAAPRFKG